MAEVINLDKLIRDDVKFILQGKEYVVPGQITVKDNLNITKFGLKIGAGDMDALEQALEAFLDIIEPKNPGLDREIFRTTLTNEQLTKLFGTLNPETLASVPVPGKNEGGADLSK